MLVERRIYIITLLITVNKHIVSVRNKKKTGTQPQEI